MKTTHTTYDIQRLRAWARRGSPLYRKHREKIVEKIIRTAERTSKN